MRTYFFFKRIRTWYLLKIERLKVKNVKKGSKKIQNTIFSENKYQSTFLTELKTTQN